MSIVREDSVGNQVRVSSPRKDARRAEAVLAALPDGKGGFAVAWSSFVQDGGGSGIFARFFGPDGLPLASEEQVNLGSRGSQRRPHLIACTSGARGPAVWALWSIEVQRRSPSPGDKFQDMYGMPCLPKVSALDSLGNETERGVLKAESGARECYGEDISFAGPFVRRLGATSFAPGPEVDLSAHTAGGSVSASALMCATGSSRENPRAVWAMRQPDSAVHSALLTWREVVEDASPMNAKIPSNRTNIVQLSPPADRYPSFLAPKPARPGTPGAGGNTSSTNNGRAQAPSELARPRFHPVPRRLSISAEGDVLAVVANEAQGSLSAQLFDMAPTVAYPTHEIEEFNARVEHTIYDVTEDQALLICWSRYRSVTCERRRLHVMMKEQPMELSWWMGAVGFLFLFWCVFGVSRVDSSSRELSVSTRSSARSPFTLMGRQMRSDGIQLGRLGTGRAILHSRMQQALQEAVNGDGSAGGGLARSVSRWRQMQKRY